MLRILIINGPNLNLLGKREPEIYGEGTLEALNEKLTALAKDLDITPVFFQSNSEGSLIDFIQKEGPGSDGIIINPGAYTHYSIAIRDAITAVGVETVEVHISNIYSREEFRHKSVIAPVCAGHLCGFGVYGYAMALSYLADLTKGK